MYEDSDPWPIKCTECGKEFVTEVRSVKSGLKVPCPLCGFKMWYPEKQFELALAQAQAGIRDPWRNMWRLQKPT
jgi:DNA-directed RNA polymerase subunit RPC12/RpoP